MLASGFFDWISGTEHRVQIIFVALTASAVVLSVWALAWAWIRVRRADHRSRLTSEMLQRGLGPAEITRVLLAYELTSPESIAAEADEDSDPSPEVHLIKAMSSQEYQGKDIQRVLVAAREIGGPDEQAVGVVREMAKARADVDDIVRALETRGPSVGSPTSTSDCGGVRTRCA